jgi:hypothetical protein
MKSTRREFVSGLTLAGAAGLLGVRPETAAAIRPLVCRARSRGQDRS